MKQNVDPSHVLDHAGKAHQVIDSMVLSEDEPVVVTDRFTVGTHRGEPQLSLRFTQNSIDINILKPGICWMLRTKNGKGDHRLAHQETIPLHDVKNDWRLHTNTPDKLHRVIQFLRIAEVPR